MRCSIGLLIVSGLLASPALSQSQPEPEKPEPTRQLSATYITMEEI
jgi:hypothetical protein